MYITQAFEEKRGGDFSFGVLVFVAVILSFRKEMSLQTIEVYIL